jgi:hypothetical protein
MERAAAEALEVRAPACRFIEITVGQGAPKGLLKHAMALALPDGRKARLA